MGWLHRCNAGIRNWNLGFDLHLGIRLFDKFCLFRSGTNMSQMDCKTNALAGQWHSWRRLWRTDHVCLEFRQGLLPWSRLVTGLRRFLHLCYMVCKKCRGSLVCRLGHQLIILKPLANFQIKDPEAPAGGKIVQWELDLVDPRMDLHFCLILEVHRNRNIIQEFLWSYKYDYGIYQPSIHNSTSLHHYQLWPRFRFCHETFGHLSRMGQVSSPFWYWIWFLSSTPLQPNYLHSLMVGFRSVIFQRECIQPEVAFAWYLLRGVASPFQLLASLAQLDLFLFAVQAPRSRSFQLVTTPQALWFFHSSHLDASSFQLPSSLPSL